MGAAIGAEIGAEMGVAIGAETAFDELLALHGPRNGVDPAPARRAMAALLASVTRAGDSEAVSRPSMREPAPVSVFVRQAGAGAGAAQVPLRALRAVATVASAGSVAQAAQALHQSATAITRAVQCAERSLGVALFERGARGMLATAAGAVLAQRVTRAFTALQVAADGLLARGAPASVASLPRLVNDALMQALVARAAHPSEAAAAAALGLSQPALHQALRRLEHVARMPLYERTRLGVRINEAGEWLLQQVKIALAEVRVGHEELARWRGEDESRVAIGALPMASDVLVPQVIALALARRPQWHLSVNDGTYGALARLLRNADIDFIVGPLRGDGVVGCLSEEPLFADRMVAVVRRGHPLLRDAAKASLRALAPYPMIGPLPDTPAHAAVERLYTQAGLERPAIGLHAHSPSLIRSVLLASDHVALLSPLQVRADVQAGLLGIASLPLPGSERTIGITQRRDTCPSSACAEVLATLRGVVAEVLADLPR